MKPRQKNQKIKANRVLFIVFRSAPEQLKQPLTLVKPLRFSHTENMIEAFGAHAVFEAVILDFIHQTPPFPDFFQRGEAWLLTFRLSHHSLPS
jgi:hypothetical protein